MLHKSQEQLENFTKTKNVVIARNITKPSLTKGNDEVVNKLILLIEIGLMFPWIQGRVESEVFLDFFSAPSRHTIYFLKDKIDHEVSK